MALHSILDQHELSADDAYRSISEWAKEDDLEGVVGTLVRVMWHHGLHPDTVGARHGWSVLHELLWQSWPDQETALLLVKRATPDLPDQRGNTALHLVVLCGPEPLGCLRHCGRWRL